uniref:Uncharacterized protein n=1 Tax=Rhizophora mucronata TaxID=61149 RepID=A0A2P2PUY3_RHIMU
MLPKIIESGTGVPYSSEIHFSPLHQPSRTPSSTQGRKK